tara:strand:+ start:693 stop:854 length:162 start_codon:yes stop_codon:yes gene_type:complete
MKTIPDTITYLKKLFNKQLDKYFSIVETIGSKLSVWAWNKRWKNRTTGTGYSN